jgi:hypothetical protein
MPAVEARAGSGDSVYCLRGRTAARPKIGRFTVSAHRERPLQEQMLQRRTVS